MNLALVSVQASQGYLWVHPIFLGKWAVLPPPLNCRPSSVWVRLMILLYLDCDIAFPSPAFARAGDGAAHGA